MKIRNLWFVLVLLAGSNNLYSGNIIIKGDAESDQEDGFSAIAGISDDAKSGKHSYEVAGDKTVLWLKKTKIEPDKYYAVSVWIKAVGDKPSLSYMGFVNYDTKGRVINYFNADGNGALAELAEPCKMTDTVIKVKDGSKWKISPNGFIAFDAKRDGSDLPNFNLSSRGISKIEKEKDLFKIVLAAPAGKSYPAGTVVREHMDGDNYQYVKYGEVPTEWTKWEGIVKGSDFRKGTESITFVLLCNLGKNDMTMLFDDVCVEELDVLPETSKK